jgi:glucose 1-dehydrogenase
MPNKRLHGEIAIVTGSDSGIGQATAIAFAREGADVAVTYFRHDDDARGTARNVEAAGQRAFVAQLDVRDPDNVKDFFRAVGEALGTPTILVNNAALDYTGQHVKDMDIADWDNLLRTNLYGPFYCCQQFIRGLDGTDRHGTIINVTSVHQEVPRVGAAAYCASKGGLRNLTTVLALELAEKNINVSNLAPGMVLTPMNQEAIEDPAVMDKQIQSIPMKRAAEPEEIARVAVFLASEDARYIQGATIVVDGALTLFQGQGA